MEFIGDSGDAEVAAVDAFHQVRGNRSGHGEGTICPKKLRKPDTPAPVSVGIHGKRSRKALVSIQWIVCNSEAADETIPSSMAKPPSTEALLATIAAYRTAPVTP